MITEQQLKCHATRVAHLRRVVFNFHPIHGTRCASRDELAIVLEFHRANHARASTAAALEMTQGRNFYSRAPGDLKNGFPGFSFDALVVDDDE